MILIVGSFAVLQIFFVARAELKVPLIAESETNKINKEPQRNFDQYSVITEFLYINEKTKRIRNKIKTTNTT
jgi:hypothetical protein